MLQAISISHRSAPLAFREKVAFQQNDIPQAIDRLKHFSNVDEALIVSTCNRTEIYFVGHPPCHLDLWLAEEQNVPLEVLRQHLTYRQGLDVVTHLFRVVSGLDSMVLGETQILGQIKKAAVLSQLSQGCKKILHRLFQMAFSTAKEVRTHTGINRNVVSIAAGAAYLAESKLNTLVGKKVLFIGAGEIIHLCMTHFRGRSPDELAIANRSTARVLPLSEKFHATLIPFKELHKQMASYDIVVSGVSSTHFLITQKYFPEETKHSSWILIDLSVPRSIDPSLKDTPGVTLYTLDDLSSFVQSGITRRCAAVRSAEDIIQKNVQRYQSWYTTLTAVDTIKKLRKSKQTLANKEAQRAIHRIRQGKEPEEVIHRLCQKIVNNMLHYPTRSLRDNIPIKMESAHTFVRHMFELDHEDG